jgi:predicted Fe-Mo cluster-binding NifX family protein
MKLRFAFAVNNENVFEEMHFGKADRYLIYTLEEGEMSLSSEEINEFKTIDENCEHGSTAKGNAIIKFLKEKDVNVLVSKQFCRNINLLNEHFIPVIIPLDRKDEIIDRLSRHLHWIKDEWENNASGFSVFTIRSGILKTSVDIMNAEEPAS